MKNRFVYFFGLTILIFGILTGIQIQKAISTDNFQEQLRKFSDVLSLTRKYYVDDVDSQKLVEAAINGMLGELDPHSVYIPPKQLEQVEEEFRGNFEGIGIEFQIINDTIVVVSAIPGGPSEALGITAGDRIVKINGEPYKKITNEDVRKKLRGPKGTKVDVTIYRPSIREFLDFTIVRDKIPLYSVDAYFMVDDETGYISLSRFAQTTFDEVKAAMDSLDKKGMRRLILDLRNNSGGYMSEAVKISDLFLDQGKMIVYTKSRIPEFVEEYRAVRPFKYEKLPVIILVNNGSASASEIVSGAIQDWDRGLIVGERTFGKGLVQRQFTLNDNSALRLTISRYYTPVGRLIQRDYTKKDKIDYYRESIDTDTTEGENIEHTLEQDTSKPVYITPKGRKVYGGGGITPDYIVKSPPLTKYTSSLLRKNLFYQYILSYLDKNGKAIQSKFKSFKSFKNDFQIDDNLLNGFINYAKSQGVEFNKEDFDKDKDYIKARLKAQIARNYWRNEGWYPVLLEVDPQFKKAITLFPEAEKFAKAK
ncbi:MAG: S41 family peptidase [Ignavibacteria bacterium]|jgi:carboxyl-terminal processing protease|nr:S41 family peptidase [Ignavibacteria bacterium]MDH7528183.1 S41 family peptidase [Ignavibacteria bacterium]